MLNGNKIISESPQTSRKIIRYFSYLQSSSALAFDTDLETILTRKKIYKTAFLVEEVSLTPENIAREYHSDGLEGKLPCESIERFSPCPRILAAGLQDLRSGYVLRSEIC